jgi:hypothetical protein
MRTARRVVVENAISAECQALHLASTALVERAIQESSSINSNEANLIALCPSTLSSPIWTRLTSSSAFVRSRAGNSAAELLHFHPQ